MMKFFLYITIPLLAFIGCSNRNLPYNFDFPEKSVQLKKKLNEISGLAWISDSSIACIQDEKAHIYFLNSKNGEIESFFDFGHNGDFEGIAIDEDTAYVLRSDGHIFISVRKQKAKEYKFKHGKNFDFEGLCLDKKSNRLLVACKEHGEKKKRNAIYVFAFSIQAKKYEKKPFLVLKKKKIHPNFKASGIAIHPNGNIYLLSSFSKTLLVLKPNGNTIYHTQLSDYIYHQPEGICFNDKGDLFIANERHKTYPTLLKLVSLNE